MKTKVIKSLTNLSFKLTTFSCNHIERESSTQLKIVSYKHRKTVK